jgi:hypothetical protein
LLCFGIATVAQVHTLRIECQKTTSQHVMCRALTSDGELARDIEIQLLATGDYRVLATGKTNTAGEYGLLHRRNGRQGSRANMASVDVW